MVEDLVGPAVVRRGGQTMRVLQFLEGLRRLGHDVLFVEFLAEPPDAGQRAYWDDVLDDWWPSDRAALLNAEDGLSYAGLSRDQVARHAERSEAVIQLAASFRAEPWPVIAGVRPRAVIDGDPGYTHLWATGEKTPHQIWGEHELYFTVGLNVGTSRSAIPTLGKRWHPLPHWAVLDWWSDAGAVTRDRFTTIGSWRDYGYFEFEGRTLGPKVEEFHRFIDLPEKAGEPVELTLAIDPSDPDLPVLRQHGWIVQDPAIVDSAARFRDYVMGSLGEFSCAKGGYVGTHSGWFGDRSACYLAAGRPVVAQATGFEDVLPVGDGLFAVASADEAAEAMRAIRRDYARHSRAARRLAERHLRAESVAARVLEECGISDVPMLAGQGDHLRQAASGVE